MTNKKKKRQEEFLKNFATSIETMMIWIKIITEYFLGENFYIADPLSPGQANVIIAYEIISNN